MALTTLSASSMSAQTTEKDLARARKILASTPLIDGHNDLAWAIREDSTAPMDVGAYDLRKRTSGHTDLERLKKGMIAGQFWSIYVPGETAVKDSGYAKTQLEQFDIAHRFIAMYPERLQLALSSQDVREAFKRGKIGSLLGMEGGHVIENSLGALRSYYELGARYMTLTHNVTLDWADAALDSARHGGLTEFGKEVVREMNRLGMLVDLSHVSPGVMSDALDVTEAPVIFSHSDARALTNVPRNVPDSILKRLDKNGGVVMVSTTRLAKMMKKAAMSVTPRTFGGSLVRIASWHGNPRILSRRSNCHRLPITSSTSARSQASIMSDSAATSTE